MFTPERAVFSILRHALANNIADLRASEASVKEESAGHTMDARARTRRANVAGGRSERETKRSGAQKWTRESEGAEEHLFCAASLAT
jgi:hypothetical protein